MLHSQDLAGQHAIPVGHEIDVIGIVVADLGQSVGKLLPLREQLFEAGKAAVHRRAARIDDSGVGQDELDQSDMPEVVGHLVDEERRTAAMDPRVFDEFGSEGCKLLAAQIV